MTTITRDDIIKLAKLSSLSLSEDEVSSLQDDLTNILNYVEQLDELNTQGVTPAYQVTGLENVLREDTVQQAQASREELLMLAPERKENQIKVPKVL